MLSTRMFKNRPMRTILTILGVGVGIGTVLFLVSFGYGLQRVILGQITTADSLLSLDVSPGISELLDLNEKNINSLRQESGVVEISRLVSFSAQININESIGDSLAYVIDPSFFRLNGLMPKYGEIFEADNERKAIISSAVTQLFNFTVDDAIGKKFKITLFVPKIYEEGLEEIEIFEREEEYTITGVIEDENASYFFIPIGTVSDLDILKFDQIKLKVSDSELMNEVRDKIIEKGFLVSSLSDTIEQADKIFQIIQIILFSFGFIALTVSAIGMFNTMTIAFLERINEIGIMRSVGITRRDVKKIFIFEAILMGFLGGVFGVAIGLILGELVNIGINLLAKNFGGRVLDLFYSPFWFILGIIIFSTIVGMLTGIYPSRRAGKLNPLEALRYK